MSAAVPRAGPLPHVEAGAELPFALALPDTQVGAKPPSSPLSPAQGGSVERRIAGQRSSDRLEAAWRVIATVPDPEVPAVSVVDLGIVRDVVEQGDVIEVVLTPTYSGCPATEAIEHDVLAALDAAGLGPARSVLRRAPAWTSDWITPEGRDRLRACGIAPPGPAAEAAVPLRFFASRVAVLACPRCASLDTERLAAFGSTACKALHRCRACGEPFEHFKPI